MESLQSKFRKFFPEGTSMTTGGWCEFTRIPEIFTFEKRWVISDEHNVILLGKQDDDENHIVHWFVMNEEQEPTFLGSSDDSTCSKLVHEKLLY